MDRAEFEVKMKDSWANDGNYLRVVCELLWELLLELRKKKE